MDPMITAAVTSALGKLSSSIVEAGIGVLKKYALESKEQTALARCLEKALKALPVKLSIQSSEEVENIVNILEYFFTKPGINAVLWEAILFEEVSTRERLNREVYDCGLDAATLPVPWEKVVRVLLEEVASALRHEAAKPDSPLRGHMQMKALSELAQDTQAVADAARLFSFWSHIPNFSSSFRCFFEAYMGLPGHPRAFGGRKDEMEYLNAWLRDPKATAHLLLTAPAGRGKTTLLVHWAQQLPPETAAVFIPISLRFDTARPRVFFPALAGRLAALHGRTLTAAEFNDTDACRDCIVDLLQKPLPGGRSLVVIVDGLDEAHGWEAGAGIFPLSLPEKTKLVLSARLLVNDDGPNGWLSRFGWSMYPGLIHTMHLEPLDRAGLIDVIKSMGTSLDKIAGDPLLADELLRLTEGDPLLVDLYVQDMWLQRDCIDRLQSHALSGTPKGMKGYFSRWWREQEKLWPDHQRREQMTRRMHAVLSILSHALGPLTAGELREMAYRVYQMEEWSIPETLKPLERFVIGDGQPGSGFVFAHSKMTVFFGSEDFISQKTSLQIRHQFAAWGKEVLVELNHGLRKPEEAPGYLLRFLGQHFADQCAGVDEYMLLVSNGWRLAWEAYEGGYSGFLSDVRRAWNAAKEASGSGHSGAGMPFLAEQIRCMLCFCSITSLYGDISPTLLAAALDAGLLSAQQVLNILRICHNQIGFWRFIVKLAKKMPHYIDELLGMSHTCVDAEERASALIAIADAVPSDMRPVVLDEALQVIRKEVRHTRHKYSIYMQYVRRQKFLSPEIAEEIRRAAEGEESPGQRANALADLLPYMEFSRAEAIAQVMEWVGQTQERVYRILALAKLLPHVPGERQEVIVPEIYRELCSLEEENEYYYLYLEDIAPFVFPIEPSAFLELVEKLDLSKRVRAVSGIFMQLSSGWKARIYAWVMELIADKDVDSLEHFNLAELYQEAPPVQRDMLKQKLLELREQAADEERWWEYCAPDLYRILSGRELDDLIAAGLTHARKLGHDWCTRDVLDTLAKEVSGEVRLEAEAAVAGLVRQILAKEPRAVDQIHCLKYLPREEAEDRAIQLLPDVKSSEASDSLPRLLARLLPFLPAPYAEETKALLAQRCGYHQWTSNNIASLRQMREDIPELIFAKARAEILQDIRANTDLMEKACDTASCIAFFQGRERRELAEEALNLLWSCDEKDPHWKYISDLDACLFFAEEEKHVVRALEAGKRLDESFFKVNWLCTVVKCTEGKMHEEAVREAYHAVKRIPVDIWHFRIGALSRVLPFLPKPEKIEIMNEFLEAAAYGDRWRVLYENFVEDGGPHHLSLIPVFRELGGDGVLEKICRAVMDITAWWP